MKKIFPTHLFVGFTLLIFTSMSFADTNNTVTPEKRLAAYTHIKELFEEDNAKVFLVVRTPHATNKYDCNSFDKLLRYEWEGILHILGIDENERRIDIEYGRNTSTRNALAYKDSPRVALGGAFDEIRGFIFSEKEIREREQDFLYGYFFQLRDGKSPRTTRIFNFTKIADGFSFETCYFSYKITNYFQ